MPVSSPAAAGVEVLRLSVQCDGMRRSIYIRRQSPLVASCSRFFSWGGALSFSMPLLMRSRAVAAFVLCLQEPEGCMREFVPKASARKGLFFFLDKGKGKVPMYLCVLQGLFCTVIFFSASWIPPAGGISIDLSHQRSGLGRSISQNAFWEMRTGFRGTLRTGARVTLFTLAL